jgi:type I restriction enzyme, S subunit
MNWNDTAYWNKNDIREFERFILREEDIVIAMDRPWISSGFKIAMIQSSDLPSLLVQRVARIRSKSSEWQKYLYFVIQHPAFELHSKPTETTVPHISPKDLQSFPIPVPDEATLQSFNQKIGTIDVIKKKSLSFYQESENLFNSLLQRAFRGEL